VIVSNDVGKLLKLQNERFFGSAGGEEAVDLVSHVRAEHRSFLVSVVDERH
jgi:hypothetical protein